MIFLETETIVNIKRITDTWTNSRDQDAILLEVQECLQVWGELHTTISEYLWVTCILAQLEGDFSSYLSSLHQFLKTKRVRPKEERTREQNRGGDTKLFKHWSQTEQDPRTVSDNEWSWSCHGIHPFDKLSRRPNYLCGFCYKNVRRVWSCKF